MRTSKKKFYRKRQTASAMAVLLTVLSPGVFPAGIAMAENVGGWIPEGRAGHARVTESNVSADSSETLEKEWDEEELDEERGAADEGNIDGGDLREDRGLVDPCQRSDGSYGKPDREGDGCDEERHVKVGEQDRERAYHVIEIEELVQEKRLLSGKGLGNEMAESRALPGLTAVVRCNPCRGTVQRVS